MVNGFRLLIRTLGRTASAVLLFSALCLALSACGTTSSEPVPRAMSITYDVGFHEYGTPVFHEHAPPHLTRAIVRVSVVLAFLFSCSDFVTLFSWG